MKVALLTKEFPPDVYGGAGVHIEYLSRELAQLVDVGVHCFGAPRSSPLVAGTYEPWMSLPAERDGGALRTMSVDLAMASAVAGADLVHSHTWYTNFAGHLAKLLYRIPHVVTAHSLEPLRPWKADQLGAGYAISSFCERTALLQADAIIAVSEAMARDVAAAYPEVDEQRIRVIHNGIDPDEYRPGGDPEVAAGHGVDPQRPTAMFVGRVTRQKGIIHLIEAIASFTPEIQVVLCAGAPDTPEIGAELQRRIADLRTRRDGIIWINEMLARADIIALLGAADVFVCPSVYEPFGLINLEAMACEVPVVASAVGGIPEIVVDGVTGSLVAVDVRPDGSPRAPAEFAHDLATAVNDLIADPARAARLGRSGRQRVVDHFSWKAIAGRTAALYEDLVG